MYIYLAHILPGFCLLTLPYLRYNPYLCVILLTLSLGFNGASVLTCLVNNQDLSPNYATTIFGLTMSVGSTSGFISPLIVGHFTKFNVSVYYGGLVCSKILSIFYFTEYK